MMLGIGKEHCVENNNYKSDAGNPDNESHPSVQQSITTHVLILQCGIYYRMVLRQYLFVVIVGILLMD